MKHKHNQKGFTLMELIITMAIIGIMAAIVLVNLNSSRRQSRNVKRIADVHEIMTALQLYFAEHESYPGPSLPSVSGPTPTEGDPPWSSFLSFWPTAPKPPDNPSGVNICDATSNPYTYTQINGGTDFTLTFCIGEQVSQYGSGVHILTSSGIN